MRGACYSMASVLQEKSKAFALQIIKVCNEIKQSKRESVLTNQLRISREFGGAEASRIPAFFIILFIHQPVSHADLGEDVPGLCGRFLDFPPQSRHQRPEVLSVVSVARAVDFPDDALGSQHLSHIPKQQ